MSHKRNPENLIKQRKGKVTLPPKDHQRLQQLSQKKQFQEQFLLHLEDEFRHVEFYLAKLRTVYNRVDLDQNKLDSVSLNYEVGYLTYKKIVDVVSALKEQIEIYEVRVKQLKQKKQMAREVVDRLQNEISDLLGKSGLSFDG